MGDIKMSKGKDKTKNVIYGCQKQQLNKLTKKEYITLRELSRLTKNMYNVGLYNVRQYYFQEKKYLTYESNYHLSKNNENYKLLNTNIAQQILKEVDIVFKSFFALIKKAKGGDYSFKNIKLPHYLEKEGYFPLIISQIRIKPNMTLDIPMSPSFRKEYGKITIKVPENLSGKKIKEIRIIPKNKARFFEIQYTYEVAEDQKELNKNNVLAVDPGVNNLATCVTNYGKCFIVDGRRLKSINQWYNKENARLQSIKDKQKITGTTKKQAIIAINRNNKVNDYIRKSSRIIINYCLKNNIGTVVVGYNPTLQKNSNLGKRNNQNFVNIPFGQLRENIKYLCRINGIQYKEQEESYTSKASFLDNDAIPAYNADNPKEYVFSGKRITRGQYQAKNGRIINADVNGALNILRKSNLVDLTVLQDSGALDTPLRIRVA
jgi:IS605 OrfB family transposase